MECIVQVIYAVVEISFMCFLIFSKSMVRWVSNLPGQMVRDGFLYPVKFEYLSVKMVSMTLQEFELLDFFFKISWDLSSI